MAKTNYGEAFLAVTNSAEDCESKSCHSDDDCRTGVASRGRVSFGNLYLKPCALEDFCMEGNICEGATEMLQRKSVICSVKDVTPRAATSDSEELSDCSSLILEEESSNGDDVLKQTDLDEPLLPSADPSEIECVVTDTSGDESSDSEDCDEVDELNSSKPASREFSCSLCTFVVLSSEGSRDLLQHLQISHKFAVRGPTIPLSTSASESGPDGADLLEKREIQQKKTITCSKTRGGCGSVFYSKQSLYSHIACSKSAGGSCWRASQPTDHVSHILSCTKCPFQEASRKRMLDHLESFHKCIRDVDSAMSAFALGCRVCGDQFWSVKDRSEHEVSQHSAEASYLILKCFICPESFSSKVCLKKHVRKYHSQEHQFFGDVGFRCRLCHATFPSFILVQEHFRKFHSAFLVFRCQKCSLILKTKKTYQVHLKSTQCGSIRQECKLCKKVLWSKRALALHYRMKHLNSNRVGFLCRICKKQFESKSERSQHYILDHQGDSPFTCSICHKGFASKSGMYGHRQTHVKTSVSKCEFCGKEFSRKDSYNEHMLIHNGPRHKCPHCDKEFVQRSNLVRHIRIHTGEKPYKCSFCEKSFSDKGACNSHIRVHTKEEACGCPYCGQIFSKKQKLKYHIRKHTGEDLVSCEFCGKNFTNSHSLKEHRLIHDQRTQLLCSHCGKGFSTAKYLQRHIVMVHQAVVVYKCPLCSRGFNQQARLKTHLMTHTGVKHLRCLLCTKAYSTRKSLRHHLLNVHNVTTEHPDYKHCFYSLSPEEAGLKVPEQPLLRPKLEPVSVDSDLEDNASTSEEDESCGEPPKLVREEPLQSTTFRQTPFPTVRTKAAMKQLPISVTPTEKKANKKTSSYDRGKTSKVMNRIQMSGRGRRQSAVSNKEILLKNFQSEDIYDSSSSESLSPKYASPSCKVNVNFSMGSKSKRLSPGKSCNEAKPSDSQGSKYETLRGGMNHSSLRSKRSSSNPSKKNLHSRH